MNSPKVIFEDNEVIVLDKPAGWIVNDAITVKDQPTVQGWLKRENKSAIAQSEEYRSGIVHRLDKETSGILLVAKTAAAFEKLQAEFKKRVVKKTYIALAHGKIEPEEGRIDAAVGRLPWRRDRFGVLAGGREASTDYKVLKYYEKDKDQFSLVELKPETGRTHQIRIHLKHIGHAIVGDTFYAGRKTARNDRKWCPRLFLHAEGILFKHPTSGEDMSFTSELPDDLSGVVELLS